MEKISFRDLQQVAKELNKKFLDANGGDQIKFVGVKKEELIEMIRAAANVLLPEDKVSKLTAKVFNELKIKIGKEKMKEEEKKEVDIKIFQTVTELNDVVKPDPLIEDSLSEDDLIDEIIDVCDTINDFEFRKSQFSDVFHEVLAKLKIEIKWAKEIKIYKYAQMIPEMEKDQFEELKQDLKENGQKFPILTYKNEIIDGRSRYNACLEIGLSPKFEEWEGKEEELLSSIISWNLKRRHLTPAQRAALGAELLPELEKIGKEKQKQAGKEKQKSEKSFRATEEAAKMTGSTKDAVSTAKKIKKESPETFNEMKTGKKSITKAKQIIKKVENPEIEEMEKKLKNSLKSASKYVDDFFDFLKNSKLKSKYPLDLIEDISNALHEMLQELE